MGEYSLLIILKRMSYLCRLDLTREMLEEDYIKDLHCNDLTNFRKVYSMFCKHAQMNLLVT